MTTQKVSRNIDQNIEIMQSMLCNDKTIKLHRFRPSDKTAAGLECCLFFVDGMVNSPLVNDNIIRPIVTHRPTVAIGRDKLSYIEQRVLQANETSQSDDFDTIIYSLLYGDTVVFCDGCSKALIIGTKNFLRRGTEEPPNEPLLKGPREGFTEPILMNISLLRRKIRNKRLKVEYFQLGSVTQTTCCICYVDGCAKESTVEELKKRLEAINRDGILDTNYIAEQIQEKKWSPIRNTGSTERPDVAAAKLLEGRVAIFVDGSPVALTVPYIFLESFQSPEDYYVNFYFAAINRSLRILGFLLSISILPIFIALMRFHRELIPSQLLLSMAASRQGVPFSITAEAIMLLLAFEILREAGSRTPASFGQTLSVVGGLVVGQAAVDAHIVSPAMLIVIAFSGITGLIAPKLKSTIIWIRLVLMVLSMLLGLYGYILGMLWLLLLLAEQSSFGIPTLSNMPIVKLGCAEDSIIRFPFHLMKNKERFLSKRSDLKSKDCV
ncbi:MAG: spore germination protein [Clostridia bacterium]|nr:spore germination protein [Clostridia bacterium]